MFVCLSLPLEISIFKQTKKPGSMHSTIKTPSSPMKHNAISFKSYRKLNSKILNWTALFGLAQSQPLSTKEKIHFIGLYETPRSSIQIDSCGAKKIKQPAYCLWCSSRARPWALSEKGEQGKGQRQEKTQQSSCSWVEGCQQQFPKTSPKASHRTNV